MATNGSRQNITMPFLQIRYINCTEKIAGLLVAVVGLLTSLWANCITVTVSIRDAYYSNQAGKYALANIVQTSQITHLIIILTSTAGLYVGLKEKNRSYISPWLIIKVIELMSLLVGCIILPLGRQDFIGIISMGICFLVIGGYITLCVWDTYGKMPVNRTPSLEDVSLTVPDELQLPKDPPSYDSFLNQAPARAHSRAPPRT